MAALVGLLAGVVREVIPEKEDVWHFGPFLFLNIPHWLWKLARDRKGNWAMLPLFIARLWKLPGSNWPTWFRTMAVSDPAGELGIYGAGGAFLGDVRGDGH